GCVAKLDTLPGALAGRPPAGTPGIGSPRWATHGRPSEQNAHPHRAGRVVVIHNGIIENYLELRTVLERRGRKMASETDTEVISHLIDEHVQRGGGLFEATRRAIQELEGSYSIVVLCESEPDRLVVAKSATPIVLGLGEGENFVASDTPAPRDHTRRVVCRAHARGGGGVRHGVARLPGREVPARAPGRPPLRGRLRERVPLPRPDPRPADPAGRGVAVG